VQKIFPQYKKTTIPGFSLINKFAEENEQSKKEYELLRRSLFLLMSKMDR
jgi:hypothetical protein